MRNEKSSLPFSIFSHIFPDRKDLHKEVIKGSEILEVLHQCPEVKKYLFSLYNCQYSEFFQVGQWFRSPRAKILQAKNG